MTGKRKPLHVSLVGAGAVGTTLAVMLSRQGHRILSVISRDLRDAKHCAKLARCGLYSSSLSDLDPATDLILIAIPEKAIRSVASTIACNPRLFFPHLRACHTSGISTSRELEPLQKKGCLTFSFHPIQTFPAGVSVNRQLESMRSISYGVEGLPRAIRFGRRLARELGGKMFKVPKDQKILYHLTCVVASNYTTTLLGVVEELARRVGGRGAFKHFSSLIGKSVQNVIRLSPAKALTGPIARGDGAIILRHLGAIRRERDLEALYRQLGVWTVALARRGKKLTAGQERELRKILADPL